MSAAIISFDPALFRAQIPAYANDTTYPDVLLQGYWDMAISFVSNVNYGWLQGSGRALALNYMTAHLIALNAIIASGNTPGQVQSATIDKVSVTLTPPPQKSQFEWWLGLTPYGQQLLALLNVNAAGGFYVGGGMEIASFKKASGIY